MLLENLMNEKVWDTSCQTAVPMSGFLCRGHVISYKALLECQFHISSFAVTSIDMGGVGEKNILEKK